jgi:hypothetical protein
MADQASVPGGVAKAAMSFQERGFNDRYVGRNLRPCLGAIGESPSESSAHETQSIV